MVIYIFNQECYGKNTRDKRRIYQFVECCERCKKQEEPFPYKQEHPEWLEHILNDDSWEEWRNNNPQKVLDFKNNLWTQKR